MNRQQQFGEVAFDVGMRVGRHADGSEIIFTRQERAVLCALALRPGVLVRRSELIGVLAHTGRPMSERNIDFLINRLRKRLGDDARSPRYIATQYGEGYVWIAPCKTVAPIAAFLVIGPVSGRNEAAGRIEQLLSALQLRLNLLTGAGRAVRLEPDWKPVLGSDTVAFALEASFYHDHDQLHGAFVLREGRTQRILGTRRIVAEPTDTAATAQAAAIWARDKVWQHLALSGGTHAAPTDTPAEIRLFDAAEALARSPESWKEAEARLSEARRQTPDDPELAILWGLNLYARLIRFSPGPTLLSPAERLQLEAEIEALVFDALPQLGANPLLQLGAAKLLFFINRGHLELAERLADEAFAHSTAFAAAHSTRAQMLMCRGEIAEAIRLYDSGLELCSYGSVFHAYLLVLKCTAQLAADDRAGVAATTLELFAANPKSRADLGILVASPATSRLDDDLELRLSAYTPELARTVLTFFYHTSARHFLSDGHRANVMRGPATHIQRKLGPQAIPDEVARVLAAG